MCQLDGDPPASCSSPKSYTGLGEGSHSFEVRAVRAGVVDPTPAIFTWTIDLTGPAASLATTPPDLTDETSATFGFGSAETGAVFECRIDDADFGRCSSPARFADLAPGSHTFKVRARDSLGNAGPVASFRWTIDTGTKTVEPGEPGTITTLDGSASLQAAAWWPPR